MLAHKPTVPASQRLDRFRMILAEYDIVATGLKTLSREVLAAGSAVPECLRGQLQDIETKFSFRREELWLVQVGDAELVALLANLDRDFIGGDPLATLSTSLQVIKRHLTRLSNSLAATLQRKANMRKEVVTPSRANRLFSFFVRNGLLPGRARAVQEQRRAARAASARQKNIERAAYSVARGLDRLASLPLRQVLDATSRCNLRCLTCYQSETQDAIHYDLADAPFEILEPAAQQASQVFIAGMGEPLRSRSAMRLIAAARAGGAYVETITNGTVASHLREAAAGVDILMVSFDGGFSGSRFVGTPSTC